MNANRSLVGCLLAAAGVLALVGCGPLPAQPRSPEVVKVRVAFPSIPDFGDLPSLMALELLADGGYAVLPTFYATPELAVEALARGDADLGNGSTRTYWAGVSKGAQVVTIAEQVANEWSIYAASDLQVCADLNGRRFAVSGESASNKAMVDAFIEENCPGTEPELVIIAGSENRAAALLAGEIDATPVELSDAIQIERQAPGRFHALANFAIDLPRLKATGVQVRREFAQVHPQAVRDYVRALLKVHRQIAQDPAVLVAEASKRLEIDPEILPQIVAAYVAVNGWDVNGGLDQDGIRYSLEFFVRSGRLEPGLTVDQVADLSFLTAVLDDLGRQ